MSLPGTLIQRLPVKLWRSSPTCINRDGQFVMITHDPEIAEFADRLVLVKDGLIENN